MGFAKYTTAVMRRRVRSEDLPDKPEDLEGGHRKDIMVSSPSKMTKVLEDLAKKCEDGTTGMRKLEITEGELYVYFDPANNKSMLIVASDEGAANDYIESTGMDIPFHDERSEGARDRDWSDW